MRKFVDDGYQSAYQILQENAEVMHRMSAALLERETLDKAEIDLLIEGKDLPPFKSPLAYVDPGSGDGGQKILKPEPGRKPGFGEGQPSPA